MNQLFLRKVNVNKDMGNVNKLVIQNDSNYKTEAHF